jgi:hypothetical protein
MGEPPLEIVAYSSGPFFPFRLKQDKMVKERSWTTQTLREIGGIEGVGVAFLEEMFGSPRANPNHRLYQKSAQAVLKALLPETGTDIRGQMRSEQELKEAAANTDRPRSFGDIMHILDSELRLITPTAPIGSVDNSATVSSSGRYYQLTHDYLVHSLREWLTRKQRETRRGRAELRLAERSSSWNAKPENRHLPFALEWANIRLLTKKKDWTDPQRTMMRRAGWVHGTRTLTTLILLGLLIWGGIEEYGRLKASGLVDKLAAASTAEVPPIIGQISSYRRWANPDLNTLVQNTDDTSREKLHASLALLPVDASQLPFLEKRLLVASPTELMVIRDALKPHRASLVPKLWSVLDSAQPGDVSLLPVASALADYDSTNERWESVGGKVVQALIRVNPVFLGPWLDALRPFRTPITPPVAAIHRNAANRLLDADQESMRRASPSPSTTSRLRRLRCRRRSPRNSYPRGMISPLIPLGPNPALLSSARSKPLRGCSPSDSPSAKRCQWTSSSPPPRICANRAIVLSDFDPTPRARASGWRLSGHVMVVLGGSLRISLLRRFG